MFSHSIKRLVLCVGLLSVFAGQSFAAEPDKAQARTAQPVKAVEKSGVQIETFRLKNGLEVIVIPNHRVPAVSHSIWFRVGAGDDPSGKSGLAHYLEHMMFKGTPRYAAGEYARIISRHGGHKNASTGRDYTVYYVSLAREQLPLLMDMESDRLLHLAPKKDDFPKEREVIIEERRMRIDTRGQSQLVEQMRATLFQNHPYHNPSIGWKQEMAGLTEKDVMDMYRQYYNPANMLLVVAGDITRKELEPLAEKYYGKLPAGTVVKREWRSEPRHIAERFVELRKNNVVQNVWKRIYTASSLVNGNTKLALPTLVMSQILGGGQTSRLYQSMVLKDKIATSTDIDYSPYNYGPGELFVSVVPAKTATAAQIEKAVAAEIKRISTEKVSADELARAKTILKADMIFDRDGLESVAFVIGSLRMLGLGTDYYDKVQGLIEQVTPEQIQEAAKATFDDRRSVVGQLLPKEQPDDDKSDDDKEPEKKGDGNGNITE